MSSAVVDAVRDLKSHVDTRIEGAIKHSKDTREKFDLFVQQMPQGGGGGGGRMARDPNYRGFWPNEQAAADFGALVVCTISKDSGVRQEAAKRFGGGGYTVRRMDGKFAGADNFVKDLGTGSDATGGYLVPDAFASMIIRNVEMFGVFRRFATVVPMSSERQRWPKRASGFTVYYPDMGVAATKSDMALAMVTLTAKKWACLCAVSNELNEDSLINVGELVATEFALAIAQAEDANGFAGNGGAAFGGVTGVLNSPNVIAVTMSAGQVAFSDLKPEHLVDLLTAVPTWAKKTDAAYYASPEVVGIIHKMTDGIGRPIYQRFADEEFPYRVNGYPVREVTAMPGLADSGAGVPFIAFGSLRLWGFLGQRRGFQIAISDDVYFLEDMLAIKAVPRQDIQEADGNAMAVLFTAAA